MLRWRMHTNFGTHTLPLTLQPLSLFVDPLLNNWLTAYNGVNPTARALLSFLRLLVLNSPSLRLCFRTVAYYSLLNYNIEFNIETPIILFHLCNKPRDGGSVV